MLYNRRIELSLHPASQLADETPTMVIADAGAVADVECELRTTDAAGNKWISRASFQTGADGGLSVELDQLLWQMEFDSHDVAPTTFSSPAGALRYELSVAGGEQREATAQERIWGDVEADAEEIRGDRFAGTLLRASGSEPARSAVLIVASSTGLAAIAPEGALLASRGHDVLIAAYMQEDGLPDSLCEIPLEVFGDAMTALREHSSAESFAVVSASVGTQGMLAALAHGLFEADRAVAIAPSSVIWQALPSEAGRPPSTAAWSLAGEPLPWVPIAGEKILPEIVKHAVVSRFTRHPRPTALHMLKTYAPGLEREADVAAAAIEAERIECPLLLMAGTDDEMWPAADMAAAIAARRAQAGCDGEDQLVIFEGAGHFLRPPIIPTTVPWNDALVSGGSAEANATAQQQGWAAMLEFLGT